MRWFCLGLVLLAAAPAPAQEQAPSVVRDLAFKVESARLTRTVGRLAAFGTRHTLSDPDAGNRGIGAARRWLEGEFLALTRAPGSRLKTYADTFPAGPDPLLPRAMDLVNLGVVLPGTDPARTREILVVAAHYDSRAGDPLDGAADAPGAVDNASGVAALLEMATVMAAEQPAVSVYFVATAGGEQGNLGSARLARQFKAAGLEVLGMVAIDRVGNTALGGGAKAGNAVRLFSEGMPPRESEGERRLRELLGTENDSPGRALARYLKRMGEHYQEDFQVLAMLRRDRVGEVGEHQAFIREGYPAVEATEWADNPDRRHQEVRSAMNRAFGDTPAYFDAGYCARITRVLVAAFRHLAYAPAAPQNVGCSGVGSADTKLWWNLPEDARIAGIVLYHRRADAVAWQETKVFPKCEGQVVPGMGIDNDVFAVATLDAQGNESLPVSPRSVTF
jgi:hypothetical protein